MRPLIRRVAAGCLALGLSGAIAPLTLAESIPSQPELNAMAADEAHEADRRLLEVYKTLTAKLPIAERPRLFVSQVAWIRWRDAERRFAGRAAGGGQAAPMAEYGLVRQLSMARTRELERVIARRGQRPEGEPPTAQEVEQRFKAVDADRKATQLKLNTLIAAEVGKMGYSDAIHADNTWSRFRDAACQFEQTWRRDAPAAVVKFECLARLTEVRMDQLQSQLEPFAPIEP